MPFGEATEQSSLQAITRGPQEYNKMLVLSLYILQEKWYLYD